jgi:hypothetical protein
MAEDKEDDPFTASRDSYAQSECHVLCITSSIMYIMYSFQKSRALLYSCFRKINHLVSDTICIHPLMYVKPCREQEISMGRPLQKADSGKPIHIMAKSYPVFPAGNQFSDF